LLFPDLFHKKSNRPVPVAHGASCRIPGVCLGLLPTAFRVIRYRFLFRFGDFTVRQIEMEFANDIMQVLFFGCLGGLVAVGISATVAKNFDRV
jgi:hypothetical protein